MAGGMGSRWTTGVGGLADKVWRLMLRDTASPRSAIPSPIRLADRHVLVRYLWMELTFLVERHTIINMEPTQHALSHGVLDGVDQGRRGARGGHNAGHAHRLQLGSRRWPISTLAEEQMAQLRAIKDALAKR